MPRGCFTVDVEVHPCGDYQARYLVHGYDDVLWTDDAGEAVAYVAEELRKAEPAGVADGQEA